MSLLTDEEIEACAADDDGSDDMAFARAIEAAWLAKLASAELPEPVATIFVDGFALHAHIPNASPLHTADQLTAWGNTRFAQGAAAQLAEKPMGYFDDDGNFEDSYKDWMKDDAGAGWQALYTRRQA